MTMKKTGTLVLSSTFFLILILSNSCNMPTISRYAAEEIVEEETVTEVIKSGSFIEMEWDYYPDEPVDYYNFYYREHGSSSWIFLKSTNSDTAEVTIAYSELGKGSWDFAVSAIDYSGNESELHTSLDETAYPVTGWYLTWEGE